MAGRKHDFPLIARIIEDNTDHQVHLMNRMQRHELRLRINDRRGDLFNGLHAIHDKLLEFDRVDDAINEADSAESRHELQEFKEQNKGWELTAKEERQSIQFNGPVGQVVVQQ